MRQLVVTCTALTGLVAASARAQPQPYPPAQPQPPGYAAPPASTGAPVPSYGATTPPPAPGYYAAPPAYSPPPAAVPPPSGTAPTYGATTTAPGYPPPPPAYAQPPAPAYPAPPSYSSTMPAYRQPGTDAAPAAGGTPPPANANAAPAPTPPGYSATTPAYPPSSAPEPPSIDYGSTDHGYGARPGHEPGSGISYPVSPRASNIDRGDSRSLIAPTLPTPALGAKAGPAEYLNAARISLAAGRTGEAQQALEMAQTRLLDRSVPYRGTTVPSGNPAVSQITEALHALAAGDRPRALQIIDATIPLASN